MANWPPSCGQRSSAPRGTWGDASPLPPAKRRVGMDGHGHTPTTRDPAPASRAGRSPRRPARPSTRPRHSPGSCHLDRGHGPRSGPRYSRRPSRSTACSACRDNRYRRGGVAASHHSARSGIRGGIDARRPARSKHLIVVLVRLRLHLLILDQERG